LSGQLVLAIGLVLWFFRRRGTCFHRFLLGHGSRLLR
jgi:hypothetical protein